MSSTLRHAVVTAIALSLALIAGACAPGTPEPDSEELTGADETTASREDGISGSVAVGTTLIATAGLNMRKGPSTGYSVLHVIPEGASVVVQQSSPQNGYYKVKHSGVIGWAYGSYLKKASSGSSDSASSGSSGSSGGSSSSSARDAAMQRAQAGVGFSYWWGHGRFHPNGPTASTKGKCTGSCPNCSHSGSYGGDCSGYVAKVWQVPSSNTSLTTDSHPYSTADFAKNTSQWSQISRGNLKKADAMNYRSGGAGHIFVYEKGDPWGSMYAYECKGCSSGCVKGYRTATSAYRAIRRSGW